jgi:ribosomal protein L16 Arg81 hydroxylase
LIYQPIFLVTHIQDFGRLPELDEEGYALLQAYIQQLNTLFSELRQNIIDVKREFFRYCNELSSSEKVVQSDSIAAIEELVKLLEQISPNTDYGDEEIEISMNLEEVIEWVNRFKLSQHNASSKYLSLASNILEL